MDKGDGKAERAAHFLLKKVNSAIYEYGMIADGDRIEVAVSGGKDSLTLLRILLYRRRFVPERYTLIAMHVIGDARGREMPLHPALEQWLQESGVEYVLKPIHLRDDEQLPMSCERCTWNRRRTLFETAQELGCNKVALGHHLDDLAETALMNLLYHGRNETMQPVRSYFGGKVTLIRPMMYVPEHEIVRFASLEDFPPPPPSCPVGADTRRGYVKDLLAEISRESRRAKSNLVRAALREYIVPSTE